MMTTGFAFALLLCVAADDDLSVLTSEKGQPAPSRLVYAHLARQAHVALDRRLQAYEKLTTVEQCRAYQARLRKFFVAQLGGLPERTPLKAEVVGKLVAKGYRIEKVIYHSRPNHRVTAALYLPDGKPPYPAVLVACGHSKSGKAAGYNQRICILLAKHGIAAMCYDPIGQGERSQILTPPGKPKYARSTTEHFLVGVGSILLGTNTAQYRIVDGIRGIDYLASRDDIDAKRIGCTGCSGGGTLTSYLMALDDRVVCAAPACYLTTFRRLIDTIGPQDAEQNIFAQVAYGMDHPDYVLMRAPKPTLICASTHDFFDIQGTWENFRQAKRLYTRLGHPERVDLVETAGKHGISKTAREAMCRWMRRWLLGVDDDVTEDDFAIHAARELQCTPRGEVLLLPGERSVFDLNADLSEHLARRRQQLWQESTKAEKRKMIRQAAGVRPLDDLPVPKVRQRGVIQRAGYTIEKLVLEQEGGVPLPGLLFVPPEPKTDAYLYVHGEGKHVDAAAGGPIEKLVSKGHRVLAVDVRGLGETARAQGNSQLGPNWKEFYVAYLLGKSFVGMRAEDILVCGRYVAGGAKPNQRSAHRVHLIGIGEASVPALHAAALERSRFASLTLRRGIRSWADVVRAPEAHNQLINTVHGALKTYDLPDLLKTMDEMKVTVEDPVNPTAKGRSPTGPIP